MTDRYKKKAVSIVFLVLLAWIFASCEKFDGDQTIPSYLYVDQFYLQNNPEIQEGKLTHDFTDVWAYVDDQLIGCFEMPATIPVLENGYHKIALYPGIKYNTQSGTRAPHIYMKPFIDEEFYFAVDTVAEFSGSKPNTMYYTNTQFDIIEEFESVSGTFIHSTISNDSVIGLYEHDPGDFDRFGNTACMGELTESGEIFEIYYFEEDKPGLTFPTGIPVIFEMEYKTNNTLIVGAIIIDGSPSQHAILILKPTNNEWKKAYVNITPTVSENATADGFSIFVRAEKDAGVETGTILLDNFKLIHRN
jgi:hypothetical protein